MSEALVLRDDARMTFQFGQAAIALKEAALSRGALIAKVSDADQQKEAIAALTEIQGLLADIEKARTAAKAPVLAFGKKIDDTAKEFVVELSQEKLRLLALVGDFQKLEEARVRAAQQAESARLAEIERQRAAEVAQAKSIDQIEDIRAKYAEKAAEAPVAPLAPAREKNQSVGKDWDIEVYDINLLYRAHPTCVELTARKSEIKALLKAGVDVKGVRATLTTTVSVRGKSSKAIEV